MRWLATVMTLIVMVSAAAAERATADFAPFDPTDPCDRARTWKRVTACHGKRGVVKTQYDTDQVKVISVSPRNEGAAHLHVYVPIKAGWGRAHLYGVLHDTSQLVSITPYPTTGGTGVRIDLGLTWRTNLSVDSLTSTRGLMRRVNSIVCAPATWACRNVITACEAYVRGKVFWTFRGELRWDAHRGLRLRGDTRNAGVVCNPPRSMLDEAE